MSISNPQKTVNPKSMDCKGTATVTISFDAMAELTVNPADIVLVMDKSGSMNQQRMIYAKQGAKELIDIVKEAGSDADEGKLGNGTRMAIVSFSSQATKMVPLTQDVEQLKTAIDSLNSGGDTNHTLAFEAAEKILADKGPNRQIIIMFTDGATTQGGNPAPVTDRLKAQGVEIFCIGLVENPDYLTGWASDPVAEHVTYTDDYKKLSEIFKETASEVVLAGAQEVMIREEVSPDFQIVSVRPPDYGTAQITGPQSLTWKIESAGRQLDMTTLSLSFEMMHIGENGGLKTFNQSIEYEDRKGNTLEFPSPEVEVICGLNPDIYPEPCPEFTEFEIPGCVDHANVKINSVNLISLGRIVQLAVTLKNVCPGKRLGVSVILTEDESDNRKKMKIVKHFLVPALGGESCQDVTLNCIQFSVPEIPNEDGSATNFCASRKFKAGVIANYLDTDYICCNVVS